MGVLENNLEMGKWGMFKLPDCFIVELFYC